MSLLVAVLVASLVGSPHCAGMCGAFVCFYGGSAAPGAGTVARALGHAAYSAGRLAAYAALGALAGGVGAGLDATGRLAGVSRAAAVVAGTLMVGWGATRIATLAGWHTARLGATAALQARLGAALRRARDWSPVARAGAVGLLTALLPCGWLYAFVATAAGTGSAARGALVMLAFWAGTLPVMLALGAGVQRLAGPLARRLPMASAALLVVLGLLSIAGKLRPVALHDSSAHAAGIAPAPATAPAAPHVAH